MKSTIRIDFKDRDNGRGLEPCLSIRLHYNYEDSRDKLLANFIGSLGGESNYLRVSFDGVLNAERDGESVQLISVLPIRSDELPSLVEEVRDRLKDIQPVKSWREDSGAITAG